MNTENSASTNLSDFWHSLGQEFRLLHHAYPMLRADWDYISGSGVQGEYIMAGGDSNAVVQFKVLAKRAASRQAGANAGELVTGWLGALKREGINFELGRVGSETNADGSQIVHVNSTIYRLFEASAIYCSILEGRAVETELQALQQAALEPHDVKAAAPTGAADTPSVEHVGQASRTMEQKPEISSEPENTTMQALVQHAAATRGLPNKAMIDDFILRCNQTEGGSKVLRKHIWLAVGHRSSRQFSYWQSNSPKTTAADDRNFRRILSMDAAEFTIFLKKKGVYPPGA